MGPMQHIIPTNTGPSMVRTPPTHGPPKKICCHKANLRDKPPSSPDPNSPTPHSPRWIPEDLRRTGNEWSAFCIPTSARPSTSLPTIQVYIKTTTGRTITLYITSGATTIRTLKNLIWTKEGIPTTAYYMTANSRILRDEIKERPALR